MRALLSNTNFRRLFLGRLVTNAGDSLYFIAAMWLVYSLTGSEFYSGLAGFLTLAPSAFQAFAGPLVDRWPLRRILVGTQLVEGALVLVIPAAYYTGHLTVWVILAVMPTLTLLNQLVYPAQSAALPRIVEKEELVAANSAFSISYQGVDMLFNALGGVLLAFVGAVTLFVVDSVTFVAAALLFVTLAVPEAGAGDVDRTADDEVDPTPTDEPRSASETPTAVADGGREPTGDGTEADESVPTDDQSVSMDDEAVSTGDQSALENDDSTHEAAPEGYLAELREGIAYLRGTVLAKLMGGSIVVNFTFGSVIAVLPAYGDALGGSGAYGILMGSVALGLFAGALLANVLEDLPFGWLSIVSMGIGAVAWTAGIAVGWTPGTAALLALALVPAGITNILIASMLQTMVPDRLLGRVSAVLGSASSMATPVGALAGGALAATYGPETLMYAVGGGLAFLALYILAVPSLRRMPAVGDVETLAA